MPTVATGTGIPAPARLRPWPRTIAVSAGLLAVLVVAQWDALAGMVAVWAGSDTFGHGFLIAPVTALLAARRWACLAATPPRAWWPGLGLLAGLAVMSAAAELIDLRVAGQLAFVLSVQALVLTVAGWRVVRVLAFPLAFLLFMVPLGDTAVPLLQDLTAKAATGLLRWLGVPVYSDGVLILIPAGGFEVAEACAGLRFLIAALVVGTVVAHTSLSGWRRRLAFVGLCLVVPILANIVRVVGIILVAHTIDYALAASTDHVLYGGLFLGIVLLLLLVCARLLRGPGTAASPSVVAGGPADVVDGRPAAMGLVVLAVPMLLLTPILVQAGRPAAAFVETPAPALPDMVGRWRRLTIAATDWRPDFPGASVDRLARYEAGGLDLDVHMVYFARQSAGAEAVSGSNRLVPDGWVLAERRSVRVRLAGHPVPAVEERLVRGRTERWVLRFTLVAGQPAAGALDAKRLQLAGLFRGDSSAVVLSLSIRSDGTGGARTALDDYASGLWSGLLAQVTARRPADG